MGISFTSVKLHLSLNYTMGKEEAEEECLSLEQVWRMESSVESGEAPALDAEYNSRM